MHNYEKIYMQNKDYRHFQATMRNYIVNVNGEMVYAEIVGQKEDVKGLLKEIKKLSGISIFKGKETIDRAAGAAYVINFEELPKGQHFGMIYDKNALRGEDSRIIIGRNDEDILQSFKKWLQESQPLPYPKGFYENLKEDAESVLFHLLVIRNYVTQLHKEGDTIKAYEISTECLGGKGAMQGAILDVAKQCGLLEVDRLRKLLRENAPKLGESNAEETKIFASLRNQRANQIYHIIEYDENTDQAFCLVDDGNEILWEEHNIEDIFYDENIGMLKSEEYKNLVANVDGKIYKAA